VETTKRRRHVYFTDEAWQKVLVKADTEKTDKWKVINEALKVYFEKEGDRKGE
jgi:hypothetical protein